MKHLAVWAGVALLAAACTGGGSEATPTTPTTTAPTTSATTATNAGATSSTAATVVSTTTVALPTSTTGAATDGTTGVDTVVEIAVEDGVVTPGGTAEVSFGDRVRLVVSAGVADEAHLHGYDLMASVTPEVPGVIEFDATIPGVFEIELEESGVPLGELEVR